MASRALPLRKVDGFDARFWMVELSQKDRLCRREGSPMSDPRRGGRIAYDMPSYPRRIAYAYLYMILRSYTGTGARETAGKILWITSQGQRKT
jgi:hypothetical protein